MLKQIVQTVEQVATATLVFFFYLIGNDIAGSVALVALVINQLRIDLNQSPVLVSRRCCSDSGKCTKSK